MKTLVQTAGSYYFNDHVDVYRLFNIRLNSNTRVVELIKANVLFPTWDKHCPLRSITTAALIKGKVRLFKEAIAWSIDSEQWSVDTRVKGYSIGNIGKIGKGARSLGPRTPALPTIEVLKDGEYLFNRAYSDRGFMDKGFPETPAVFDWNEKDRNFSKDWEDDEVLNDHENRDDILKVLRQWHTESDLVCMSSVIPDEEKGEGDWLMSDKWDNGLREDEGESYPGYDGWVEEQDISHGVAFNGGVRFANAAYKVQELAHWKEGFNSLKFQRHCTTQANSRGVGMLSLGRVATTRIKNAKLKPKTGRLTAKERERLFAKQFANR